MKVAIAKGGLQVGTWNHRVIQRSNAHEKWLAIHEVHYDADGTVRGWTDEPTNPRGEDMAGLHESLAMMMRACNKPVLIEVLTVTGKKTKATLVELRPGSKAVKGAPVSGLPVHQRAALLAMKSAVEDAVKPKGKK